MFPEWAFTSLLHLIETCLHCQCSPCAVLGHYLQFSDEREVSFWVVSVKHSDNPFVPFLTLHLLLGRKFPWHLQTNSLFSVKLSKTICFPHYVLKKKKKSQVCLLVCWFYHLANISSLFSFIPLLPTCLSFSQAFHLDCKVFGTETAFWSVLVLCSSESCIRLPGCYGNTSSKALNNNLV